MHGGKSIQLFKDSIFFSLTDRKFTFKFTNSSRDSGIIGLEELAASVSLHNTAAEDKTIGKKKKSPYKIAENLSRLVLISHS